jgi:tetratricopeptide (TPR) repeat protein
MVNVAALADELEEVLGSGAGGSGRAVEVFERAVSACRNDPAVAGELDLALLLDELAETYEQQGRIDEALASMREAITAGYTGAPDPRCRLAEIQLRAGRPEPVHAIFAQVYAETPGDVWLYNNAGLEYGAAGDPTRALAWLTPGLKLALDTGDPERLVAQLADLRREQLTALGREPDELDARADAFLTRHRSAPQGRSPDRQSTVFTTSQAGPGASSAPAATTPHGTPARQPRLPLAVSWFPAEEFAAALQCWPGLAEEWGTDHTSYTHQLEDHLRRRSATTSGQVWIVPVFLEAYRSWCQRQERDPASSEARAGYAAEQARSNAPDLIAWPPGRNAACWCGSARKYKKCCGHPMITDRSGSA